MWCCATSICDGIIWMNSNFCLACFAREVIILSNVMREVDLNESLSTDWTFMKRQNTSSSQIIGREWPPVLTIIFLLAHHHLLMQLSRIAGTKPVPAFREATTTAFPLTSSSIPLRPGRPTPCLAILWELHGQVTTLATPSMRKCWPSSKSRDRRSSLPRQTSDPLTRPPASGCLSPALQRATSRQRPLQV